MPTKPQSRKNLRPHPLNLKRGGAKPRAALSIPELEYCSWRAQGAGVADAVRYSGLKVANIYSIEKIPLVAKTIEELKAEFRKDAVDRTKKRAEDLAVFVDGEYRHRMRTMTTHEVRGDADIVKALEVGFKGCGAIEPSRIVNQATAGSMATAQAGIFAKRLYLPEWRRETIEKLQDDERSGSRSEVPNGTELHSGQ